MYFDELQPNGDYKRTRQLFLHNQYLYLLLICGIPGLLAFLGFLTAAVGSRALAAVGHRRLRLGGGRRDDHAERRS